MAIMGEHSGRDWSAKYPPHTARQRYGSRRSMMLSDVPFVPPTRREQGFIIWELGNGNYVCCDLIADRDTAIKGEGVQTLEINNTDTGMQTSIPLYQAMNMGRKLVESHKKDSIEYKWGAVLCSAASLPPLGRSFRETKPESYSRIQQHD